jgi:hypothetical protein
MGKTYQGVDAELVGWIRRQPVFFVATAPLDPQGHVNASPKGLDSFAVLDSDTVAYLDLTGSGVETIAHLRENGRITILFCAFEGPPKIVRLHGRGEAVFPGEPAWDALAARFPAALVAGPGVRSIVRVRLSRVSDSCGYGVPRMRFEGERDQLLLWAERKGVEGTREYRRERNAKSLDGLPGFPSDAGK